MLTRLLEQSDGVIATGAALRQFTTTSVAALQFLDDYLVELPLSHAATIAWDGAQWLEPAPAHTRSNASLARADRDGYLARLLIELPAIPGLSSPDLDAYLVMLEEWLADRLLTTAECEALAALAQSIPLSSQQVTAAHLASLSGLAVAAWADGVVTGAERDDLDRVATLLGLDATDVDAALAAASKQEQALPAPASGLGLAPGDRRPATGSCSPGRHPCPDHAHDGGRGSRPGDHVVGVEEDPRRGHGRPAERVDEGPQGPRVGYPGHRRAGVPQRMQAASRDPRQSLTWTRCRRERGRVRAVEEGAAQAAVRQLRPRVRRPESGLPHRSRPCVPSGPVRGDGRDTGELDGPENLQPLCGPCNRYESTWTHEELRARRFIEWREPIDWRVASGDPVRGDVIEWPKGFDWDTGEWVDHVLSGTDRDRWLDALRDGPYQEAREIPAKAGRIERRTRADWARGMLFDYPVRPMDDDDATTAAAPRGPLDAGGTRRHLFTRHWMADRPSRATSSTPTSLCRLHRCE